MSGMHTGNKTMGWTRADSTTVGGWNVDVGGGWLIGTVGALEMAAEKAPSPGIQRPQMVTILGLSAPPEGQQQSPFHGMWNAVTSMIFR